MSSVARNKMAKTPDTAKYPEHQIRPDLNGEMAEATPTLLFPATTAQKETNKLLCQVINSIEHYSDYQMVVGMLLAESATRPSLVICSSSVPVDVEKQLNELIFSTERLKK